MSRHEITGLGFLLTLRWRRGSWWEGVVCVVVVWGGAGGRIFAIQNTPSTIQAVYFIRLSERQGLYCTAQLAAFDQLVTCGFRHFSNYPAGEISCHFYTNCRVGENAISNIFSSPYGLATKMNFIRNEHSIVPRKCQHKQAHQSLAPNFSEGMNSLYL